MLKILLGYVLAVLSACAPTVQNGPLAPRSVDAIVPGEGSVLLLNFTDLTYQKWNPGIPADSARAYLQDRTRWLSLSVPEMPFYPVQAAAGRRGHFFLLDKAGHRICQFDGYAQLLSCMSLPRPWPLGGLESIDLFWTPDGAFTAIDKNRGKVARFAEMSLRGQSSQLQLRQTFDISLGLQQCVWLPYSPDLCCRAGSEWKCFDDYMNPKRGSESGTAPTTFAGEKYGSLYFKLPETASGQSTAAGLCYAPEKKTLEPCPDA